MSAQEYWKSLDERTRQWLTAGFTPTPPLNVWEWARDHVDFSLVPNYDTPLHERYDPNYLPFWKEPAECITDPNIKEIIALKCSRAGGSENILLNPIRYSVAVRPQPTLYVTGDQLSAESMMEERIKRGLKASKQTKRKLAQASETQHRIMFPDMDLFITWPKAKQAFKQRGYGLVLCDELSTWPEYSADMARKRTSSYPFAHIVMISSPDPAQKRGSDEDPIFVEYKRGDQRKWHCTYAGHEFVFEMGDKTSTHGLKWSANCKREDGTWDYDMVRSTAHYVTPSGDILSESDRMDVVRGGKWIPTAKAPGNVRSYYVNAFMTPFDSFGGIAVAFLKAKAAGPQALRTFLYEYLAEPWYGEKQTIEVNSIEQRRGSYGHGQRIVTLPSYKFITDKRSVVLMTVDVQKDRFYAVVREWFDGGDSALVEFAECTMWKDLSALAAKHGVTKTAIDMGYTERRVESLEQIFYGSIKGAIPFFGRDSLKEAFNVRKDYDPFEGTGKQGRHKLPMVTFQPNAIKFMLARLMDGTDAHQWLLPSNVPPEYIYQVTAEECIDGQWVKRNRDNHALDCETMHLTLASVLGIYRVAGIDVDVGVDSQPVSQQSQPATARKRGVYYG